MGSLIVIFSELIINALEQVKSITYIPYINTYTLFTLEIYRVAVELISLRKWVKNKIKYTILQFQYYL